MGDLKDDPEHISVRMQGATPPATYDLKPREAAFHGVQALRMTPVEGSEVFGRSGLLTHRYMSPQGRFEWLRLDQGLRPVYQGLQQWRVHAPCRRPELEGCSGGLAVVSDWRR